MTPILLAALAVLAVIHVVIVVNITLGPFLAGFGRPAGRPLVSILVPARNEEQNIAGCLESLRRQSHAAIEIVCYNDQSDDATGEEARRIAREDERIRVVDGGPVPDGWTGKNHACASLARQATGEILIFMDADVRPGEDAVANTVAAFEQSRAHALSSFPEQRFTSLAARVMVPMMDVLLYSFLPLPLVSRSRFSSLVAANGQWIAFRREAYERIGGHAAVRDHLVEDMALARRVKLQGLRFLLTSGVGAVSCSMYAGAREVLQGFSKNFFAAFDFSVLKFTPVLLLFVAVFVLPYAALVAVPGCLPVLGVLLNVSFRLLLAGRMKHGFVSALLHPVGAAAAVLIGLNAVRLALLHRGVTWKGRRIPVRTSST